jgi:hypothetical protein
MYKSVQANVERKLKLVKYDDITKVPVPLSNHRYVGIEIEFLSEHSEFGLAQALGRHYSSLWEKWFSYSAQAGGMQADYPDRCHEIRVLSRPERLATRLMTIKDILKMMEAKINSSCGLHVHLDMRHFDYVQAGKNLIACQEALFRFCDKARRHNDRWCPPNPSHYWDPSLYTRDVAINAKLSFTKRKTIEVRMKEGTTDINEMYLWTELLRAIAYRDPVGRDIVTPEGLLELKLGHELETYVKKGVKW